MWPETIVSYGIILQHISVLSLTMSGLTYKLTFIFADVSLFNHVNIKHLLNTHLMGHENDFHNKQFSFNAQLM